MPDSHYVPLQWPGVAPGRRLATQDLEPARQAPRRLTPQRSPRPTSTFQRPTGVPRWIGQPRSIARPVTQGVAFLSCARHYCGAPKTACAPSHTAEGVGTARSSTRTASVWVHCRMLPPLQVVASRASARAPRPIAQSRRAWETHCISYTRTRAQTGTQTKYLRSYANHDDFKGIKTHRATISKLLEIT